jgi:hypothetical protein
MPPWLIRLYAWLIRHDACPCRLGRPFSRLCGWLDARVFWSD